jgi:hypothetical protein
MGSIPSASISAATRRRRCGRSDGRSSRAFAKEK